MSKDMVRFGFIGAGAVSHGSAHSVLAHPAGRLVAVQDSHAGRCDELCTAVGAGRSFRTVEDLVGCDEVDAVYIAVPNKFHAPYALQAIAAGKHVLLEKPFAMNAEEAEAVVEAGRRAGVVVTVGMNQRFGDRAQQFRRLVEEGVFGEIYHAKAYWFRRAGIPRLGTWFGDRRLAGGGCLYDIGVHLLDLCLWVTGKFYPVAVFGSTYTKFGNRGLGEGGWGKSDRAEEAVFDVEDFATGQIRFADGSTVSLDVSWACHRSEGHHQDVEIFGTEAGGSVMGGKIYRVVEGGCHAVIEAGQREPIYPHRDRFHNFINHLLGREALCVTAEQAVVVQRILDGLAQSALTGGSVEVKK